MKKKSNGQTALREEGSRRASLIGMAAKLFREKGFEATTIRDIAGAVGMGSGSPFCHFRSKQHLLGCIVLEGMAEVLNAAEVLAARRMSPVERFRSLMRLHVDTLHRPGNDFAAVMLYEWRALTPESRRQLVALMDRYESVWHDCLLRLQRAGQFSGDPRLARKMILGAANWSLRWYRPEGGLATDELADTTADIFLGPAARRPPPAARRAGHGRRPASADFRGQSPASSSPQ